MIHTSQRKQGLVSVIMAAYNAGKFIRSSVQSVLNQEYSTLELIIVDDGSSDDTIEVASSFNDPRIRIFALKENKGVSAARNRGIAESKGEFIAFLDADDLYPPKSISARMPYFEDPEVEFVDGIIEAKEFETKNSRVIIRSLTFIGNPLRALFHLDPTCFYGNTPIFRIVEGKNYAFVEGLTHGEDLLFFISVANTGKMVTVPFKTLIYRLGSVSAMSNIHKLEQGYFMLYKIMCKKQYGSAEDRAFFKTKIRSIMTRTYLSKFDLISAARIYIRHVFI